MSTSNIPPQAGNLTQQLVTAPPVNTQEIGFLVRNWVHYDNLATGLYRQTINARKVRDEFETKILDSLRSSNMENAVIQIAGGRLHVQEERHNQPLSLTRIEEILHTYYVSRNLPDDTSNIMKFMKKQRGFEVVKKLRKQSGPSPSSLPPPPPPSSQG
jgi:hypothetical protein